MSIHSVSSYPHLPARQASGSFATPSLLFSGSHSDQFQRQANSTASQKNIFQKGIDGVKTLLGYMKDTKNRPFLKGLLYQYGIPSLVGVSAILLGPIGWLLAIPGIPLAMAASWRGEQLVEKAVQTAHKKGLKGDPLKRLAKMGIIYDTPTERTAKEFTYQFNRVLREVFGGEKGTPMNKVRRALSFKPGSKNAQWARTFFELKAKHIEKSGWIGKGGRKLMSKLQVGPLKPIMLGLSVILNGLFFISHRKAFNEILSRNLKKAATAV